MSLICGIIPRNTNHVIDSTFLDCFIPHLLSLLNYCYVIMILQCTCTCMYGCFCVPFDDYLKLSSIPTSHLFVFFSVPQPVSDIDVTVSDLTSLTVYWTYPSDSEYTGAKVTCTTNYHDKFNCEDKTASKDESSVSYDGLIPGVEYEFTVTVVSNGQSSPPSPPKSKTLGNI